MSILLLQGNLPVTDNPGLDSVDPRYDGIVSYVQEENFIVAITLIEELFEENIFDIRMICYYLYGYWLDNSFASLNEVLQCFNNLLSDNFEAIGPIANREQNFEKSFSWMMRQIFKKITYEEKKNSSLWQQWIASISEEEISQILEAGEKSKVQGARLQGRLKDALEELERDMIREGLRRTGWNKSKLAKELGISRAGLIMKVEKYGLDKRKMAR